MECFKCGADGSKVRMFDAISGLGIVHICERCSKEEGLPLIKRPTTEQLKRAESNTPVRKVLEEMSGNKISNQKIYERDKKLLEKEEITLRELVEKKYENTPKKSLPRPDLIENFHWVIMRARRSRKVSHKQLARAISESEAALQMAERGILPEDDNKLVHKLENYLGIKLVKDKSPFSVKKEESFSLNKENLKESYLMFDPYASKRITISDLQEIKKKKQEQEEIEEINENFPEEEILEDLTSEEIDKIIFRKRD
jgi:ribosome-binding protein aMBF1 (putative translation factor)